MGLFPHVLDFGLRIPRMLLTFLIEVGYMLFWALSKSYLNPFICLLAWSCVPFIVWWLVLFLGLLSVSFLCQSLSCYDPAVIHLYSIVFTQKWPPFLDRGNKSWTSHYFLTNLYSIKCFKCPVTSRMYPFVCIPPTTFPMSQVLDYLLLPLCLISSSCHLVFTLFYPYLNLVIPFS